MPNLTVTDGLCSSVLTDVPDQLSPREALDLADRLRAMALAVATAENERRTVEARAAIMAAPTEEAALAAYDRARGSHWLSD